MPMSVTAPELDTMERTAQHVSHFHFHYLKSIMLYHTDDLNIICFFFACVCVLSGIFYLAQDHSETKAKHATLPADAL